MRYFGAIILKEEEKVLSIAVLNPSYNPHKETLQNLFKEFSLQFKEITQEQFTEAISWLEQEEYLCGLLKKIKQEIYAESEEKDSSIHLLLSFILQNAVLKHVSDVHFELDFETTRVRFRIDGVLVDKFCFEEWIFAPISTSIKLLAHLNLTESKLPQDGRFSLMLKDKKESNHTFDFRVSTLPLVQGESIVLRILDKHKTLLPLESLGFRKEELKEIQGLFNLPFGLILITGPTGSGKSTTMYGILNILKERNLKIITLEDPVEYRLKHINQVALRGGMSFANILRNVLRQDPDVISLGEVRDKESLQIAIQAAFTGHLVFATLHTNDALDSIVRLLDMGIESHFIAQALSGIIAQRLLRKLCVCKGVDTEGKFFARGCAQCNNTGYSGRIAIAEILSSSALLESFIKGKVGKQEILSVLDKNADFTLERKAQKLVKSGITDAAEMNRVVKNALYC